jgi:hypothetical protein
MPDFTVCYGASGVTGLTATLRSTTSPYNAITGSIGLSLTEQGTSGNYQATSDAADGVYQVDVLRSGTKEGFGFLYLRPGVIPLVESSLEHVMKRQEGFRFAAIGTPTVSTVAGDSSVLSGVANAYTSSAVTCLTGVNAGLTRRCSSYNHTTRVLTVDEFPTAPSAGDLFQIIGVVKQ